MKHFCKSCGKTNLYQDSAPVYCGYCGIKFNLNKPDKYSYSSTEDTSVNNNLPVETEKVKLVKPKFELVTYNNRVENLADILGVDTTGPNDGVTSSGVELSQQNTPADPQSGIQKSREQILQEFASESSAFRKEKINDN